MYIDEFGLVLVYKTWSVLTGLCHKATVDVIVIWQCCVCMYAKYQVCVCVSALWWVFCSNFHMLCGIDHTHAQTVVEHWFLVSYLTCWWCFDIVCILVTVRFPKLAKPLTLNFHGPLPLIVYAHVDIINIHHLVIPTVCLLITFQL